MTKAMNIIKMTTNANEVTQFINSPLLILFRIKRILAYQQNNFLILLVDQYHNYIR